WIGPNRFDHSHRVAIGQRRQAERDVLQVFDVDTAEAEDQDGTVYFVARYPEDDLYSSLDEFLHEEAFDHQATISELTFHRRGRVHKFLLGSDAETDGLEFRLVDDLRTEGLEDDRIADFFGCPAELLDAAHDPRLRRSDAVGIQQGVRLLAPQPRATFANGAVEDRLRLGPIHRESAELSLIPFPVFSIAVHGGKGSRGTLGKQVRRAAVADEFHESGAILRPAEEIAQDRFRMVLRRLPHR